MQRRPRSSDAISTEVFGNALRAAAHRHLLGPGGEELAERRRGLADELAELVERIERMRDFVPT